VRSFNPPPTCSSLFLIVCLSHGRICSIAPQAASAQNRLNPIICFHLTSLCYACVGVNFMEKTINIRNNDINFSIWDLGGTRPCPPFSPFYKRKALRHTGAHAPPLSLCPSLCAMRACVVCALGSREFIAMLPLVCNDAVAILFMFDLSRKSTLISIKEWFRQARGFNKARTTTTPPLHCLFLSSHLRQARHDLRSVAVALSPSFVRAERYSVPDRHQIRSLRHVPQRRAGGDHKAGTTVIDDRVWTVV
jgi:hypothetical protein